MIMDSYEDRFAHCKTLDDLFLEKNSVCGSFILISDSVCHSCTCHVCPVEDCFLLNAARIKGEFSKISPECGRSSDSSPKCSP